MAVLDGSVSVAGSATSVPSTGAAAPASFVSTVSVGVVALGVSFLEAVGSVEISVRGTTVNPD